MNQGIDPTDEQLIQLVNKNTIGAMTARWTRNIIANQDLIKRTRGINDLFKDNSGIDLKDVPAIIVGGGPSLDKNVDLLKNLRNKALIVASDSTLKMLLSKGIKPHIVVVTDAEWGEWGNPFENLPMSTKDILLVVEVFANRKILESWEGDIYFYATGGVEGNPLSEIVEQEFCGHPVGKLACGGNVSSTAFSLAVGIFKCDPIIMIGVDLGYYDQKFHHSKGMDVPHNVGNERVVEDIFGRKMLTTPVFQAYRYWFERMACGNLDPNQGKVNGTLINATEGGQLCKGWLIQPLSFVEEKYLTKEYDIDGILEKRKDALTIEKKRFGKVLTDPEEEKKETDQLELELKSDNKDKKEVSKKKEV